MNTQQAIQRCITRCAKSKDGRGAWRAETSLLNELWPAEPDLPGQYIARDVAAAARRIGEWLRTAPNVRAKRETRDD